MTATKAKQRTLTVRIPPLLLLLVLMTASPLACSNPEPDAARATSENRTPVTLQLNWLPSPEFGGMYQAELDGFFAEEGLDVKLRPGSDGVPAPQLAATGNVEFAIVDGPQILELNNYGGTLVALFAVYQQNPIGIMVHADSPYQTLKELWQDPKATVGCSTELASIQAIQRAYGTRRGARTVSYNLPAFVAGTQTASQCFVVEEPIALERKGIETRVFLANEVGFNPYTTVLVTRRAYVENNPATCAAMVRALARGWEAYLASPERANRRMVELNPGADFAAMQQAARRQVALVESNETARLGLGAMTRDRWHAIAQELYRLGRIDSIPDVESIFQWKPSPPNRAPPTTPTASNPVRAPKDGATRANLASKHRVTTSRPPEPWTGKERRASRLQESGSIHSSAR